MGRTLGVVSYAFTFRNGVVATSVKLGLNVGDQDSLLVFCHHFVVCCVYQQTRKWKREVHANTGSVSAERFVRWVDCHFVLSGVNEKHRVAGRNRTAVTLVHSQSPETNTGRPQLPGPGLKRHISHWERPSLRLDDQAALSLQLSPPSTGGGCRPITAHGWRKLGTLLAWKPAWTGLEPAFPHS